MGVRPRKEESQVKMAALGSALLSSLGLTQAERAFRPWWDAIEDHIVYTIIILGILVAPTSLVMTASPLDCTLCRQENCGLDHLNPADTTDDFGFFTRRYCALENLPVTVLYFPYLILAIATLLFMTDRPFVLVIFSSANMEELHKMLVVEDPFSKEFNRKEEAWELHHLTAASTSFFFSYLLRTLASLASSLAPLLILLFSWDDFQSDRLFCQVHTKWYECIGHPVDFYKIILILVLVLLSLYFLLNVYNLFWLLFPSLTRLGRLMAVYKSSCKKEELGQLDEFYYESRNQRLLLDLLCSSSGPALPLRSLALLDPAFNHSLVPCQVGGLVQARVLQSSLLAHLLKSSSTSIAFLAQAGDTCRPLSWVSPQLLEASFTSLPLSEPIVVTTLVNGKVVASSKVLLPTTTELQLKSGGKEATIQQQHSLVVVSEEVEGNSDMRKREEHERRVEEGGLEAE